MMHLLKRLLLPLIATGALTTGLVVALPAVAQAQTASCNTTTLPLGGGPATKATCQLAGFAPNEPLASSSPGNPRFFSNDAGFQADAAGRSFYTFFSKDCLTPPSSVVVITGQTSGRTVNLPFTTVPSKFCPTGGTTPPVVNPPVGKPPVGLPKAGPPHTGGIGDVNPLNGLIALGLLAAGVGVGAMRFRRATGASQSS